MTASTSPRPGVAGPGRTIKVLLIDDQPIIGEAVRKMLAAEPDIELEFCSDPTQAIRRANEFAPTVILQDLVMPEVDGLTLVRFLRANPATRDVPLIVLSSKEEPVVKAEAFAKGANDYLVKLPDKIELIARIRYHSRGYIALLERNEAYQRLAESRRQLAEEVDQAAKYVFSLLPAKLTEGPIRTDWRFVPSTQLGGDSFGYHWLDDDHFAMYLLDVSGHGVGASLLSVTAMNVLRLMTLPNVDFRDPGQVLQALDGSFAMDKHDGRYFTIWYGVYRKSSREVIYSGGGHPPAALVAGSSREALTLTQLESQGPNIGLALDLPFDTVRITLPEIARLYIYSDGAFEISKTDNTMATMDEFFEFLTTHRGEPDLIDRVVARAHQLRGGTNLEDDFSVLEVTF